VRGSARAQQNHRAAMDPVQGSVRQWATTNSRGRWGGGGFARAEQGNPSQPPEVEKFAIMESRRCGFDDLEA
jgi:hypothetical protein